MIHSQIIGNRVSNTVKFGEEHEIEGHLLSVKKVPAEGGSKLK